MGNDWTLLSGYKVDRSLCGEPSLSHQGPRYRQKGSPQKRVHKVYGQTNLWGNPFRKKTLTINLPTASSDPFLWGGFSPLETMPPPR